MAYYRQVAAEINTACDDGRLPAGPPRHGFRPALRDGQLFAIGNTFVEFAHFTLRFRRFSAHAPPSEGDAESLRLFRDLTRSRLSHSAGTAELGQPGPTPLELQRVAVLHTVGKTLRWVLFLLFLAAQTVALVRTVQCLVRRTWSFPLTVAAAAWGGAVAYLLITATIQVTSYPILSISSFAPVYPLILVFMGAALWDAAAAWRPAPASVAHEPVAVPAPAVAVSAPVEPENPRLTRLLPWGGALAALVPFLIWQRQFAELFWFADDYFLLDQLAATGFWPWLRVPFTESFVPVFKLLWGGAALQFNGSYLALLWLLWLTHAANAFLLGRLLRQHGLPWFGTAVALLLFALPAANIETLGWSVQWSAVLATFFMLLALVWHAAHPDANERPSLRVHGTLFLLVGASACCFARGVLTGGVVALALLLPALLAGVRSGWPRRLGLALLCLSPALIVIGIMMATSSGNHQNLGGHLTEAAVFGLGFFLLNPGFLLLNAASWSPLILVLLAGLKLALVLAGLKLAGPRLRALLLVLLAYDLGNAVLLGIGRYHTGIYTAISSRYYYSSLLATLPFLGVVLTAAGARLRARGSWRTLVQAAALAAVLWYGLRGWPAELASFTGWRGTDLRRQMQAPAVPGSKEMVPALPFMHVERAKALIKAYHLH